MGNANWYMVKTDELLHKPKKAKRTTWKPQNGSTQLLCKLCCALQPVESYDKTTGLLRMQCGHQRGQTS